MAMLTVEGVFENGRIRLSDNVAVPDHTKVYVVIPAVEAKPAYSGSPRLVRTEQASDFAKQIIEVPADAEL